VEQQVEMKAQRRAARGKNAMRRLRAQGQVPAVVYGLGEDSLAVALEVKSISRIVNSRSGHNQILNLSVDGGETAAVLTVDWQVDPVSGALLHVDMQRVDLKKTIRLAVPISIVGVSAGAKDQGGVEELVTRQVEIECLPLAVPEKIELDVSELLIGQAIRVRDLPPNENYRVLSQPDRVLMHVVAPRAEEEVKPAEAVPTEPEVIEKGKVEEKSEETKEKE
jgi:large subunit ribosomal protein L25